MDGLTLNNPKEHDRVTAEEYERARKAQAARTAAERRVQAAAVTKLPKPQRGAIMVAITSGAVEGNGIIRKGMRLRADHEWVKRYPRLFVPDGTDPREIPAERTLGWFDEGGAT